MAVPEFKANNMYQLLREERVEEFNDLLEQGHEADLTNCDLRGLDLRGLNADGLDMSGCYFRQANLRGIDFSFTRLDGASINAAKVSGVLFPDDLAAEEILLSITHGTRMRYQKSIIVRQKSKPKAEAIANLGKTDETETKE